MILDLWLNSDHNSKIITDNGIGHADATTTR